jgi:hypothetical protein
MTKKYTMKMLHIDKKRLRAEQLLLVMRDEKSNRHKRREAKAEYDNLLLEIGSMLTVYRKEHCV